MYLPSTYLQSTMFCNKILEVSVALTLCKGKKKSEQESESM